MADHNPDITQEHHGRFREPGDKPRYRWDPQTQQWLPVNPGEAHIDAMAERLQAESEVYVPGRPRRTVEVPEGDVPWHQRVDLEDVLRKATAFVLFALVVIALTLR